MKQFRRAFVTDPTHDISAIIPYAEEMHFVFDGRERYDEMPQKAMDCFNEFFDPDKDVIITMGGIVANFIIGYVLERCLNNLFPHSVTIGIYKDHDYQFTRI